MGVAEATDVVLNVVVLLMFTRLEEVLVMLVLVEAIDVMAAEILERGLVALLVLVDGIVVAVLVGIKTVVELGVADVEFAKVLEEEFRLVESVTEGTKLEDGITVTSNPLVEAAEPETGPAVTLLDIVEEIEGALVRLAATVLEFQPLYEMLPDRATVEAGRLGTVW